MDSPHVDQRTYRKFPPKPPSVSETDHSRSDAAQLTRGCESVTDPDRDRYPPGYMQLVHRHRLSGGPRVLVPRRNSLAT